MTPAVRDDPRQPLHVATRLPMPRALIDLDAVATNTRLLADRAAGDLLAVVKADGLGCGACGVGRTALRNGASALGVTGLTDAFALRVVGITAPILSWLNPVEADWAGAAAHDIDLAVPSRRHLDAVARSAAGLRVHLQLDTGSALGGADPAEWSALCRAAAQYEARCAVRVVGIMGQLVRGDAPEHPDDVSGRDRFVWGVRVARAAGLRPRHRHLAATAATLADPRTHHSLVRVGRGLVGIDPGRVTRLRPAMTLTAPVVESRRVAAGTAVGVDPTWRPDRPTGLASIALGYADGVPDVAAGRAEVLLAGRRRPVIGTVGMDEIVVDTGDDDIPSGATATFFGTGDAGEPTLDEWAGWAGVLPQRVLAGIGPRVVRVCDGAAEDVD